MAEQLVELLLHQQQQLDTDTSIFETPTVAGPGFLNLSYRPSYLSAAMRILAESDYYVAPSSSRRQRKTIVLDYSSPNIAKDMHVGHLRSTVIGDCLARVLELQGHKVVRLNHVGDWGTQFGMLVTHMKDSSSSTTSTAERNEDAAAAAAPSVGDLVVLYRQAKQRFDAEEDFRDRARQGVVDLQAGKPEAVQAWKALCAASRKEFEHMYALVGD